MSEIIDFRVTLPASEWVDPSEGRDNEYMANYAASTRASAGAAVMPRR